MTSTSKIVLLLDDDSLHAKSLIKVLRSLGPQIDVDVVTGSQFSFETVWDILLVNYDSLLNDSRVSFVDMFSKIENKKNMIIYSAPLSKNRAELVQLLSKLDLTNFLARNY